MMQWLLTLPEHNFYGTAARLKLEQTATSEASSGGTELAPELPDSADTTDAAGSERTKCQPNRTSDV